ncbi:MAG: hypothetical protein H7336_07490 [Bacteriovorax sp.]|nr:hypothetical protein [Bacteriovorax sp.]
MKNIMHTSFFILLLSAALSGCTQSTSTTNKSKSSSASTTGSTGGGTDGGTVVVTDGTTTVSGCSGGVARSGATSCYYSNLPRMVFSGPGTYGQTLWSSSTGLPSSISPSQFRTDASFAVRMKPSYPVANEISRQGRTCGQYLTTNFKKLKVYVMFRRTVDSIGEVKELTATVGSYSNTARFTVPGGTTEPYILEVVGVASDHRCQANIYGALASTQTAACNAGTLYLDIPYRNPTTVQTECVAFNMDMATDNTYDLPN